MVGVDIAEGMVRRAVSYAGDNGIRNVALAAISGPEDLLHKTAENTRAKLIFCIRCWSFSTFRISPLSKDICTR